MFSSLFPTFGRLLDWWVRKFNISYDDVKKYEKSLLPKTRYHLPMPPCKPPKQESTNYFIFYVDKNKVANLSCCGGELMLRTYHKQLKETDASIFAVVKGDIVNM